MNILHTADLHLKSINDERWYALKTLLSLAKEKEIELFIIAGDLFDDYNAAEELRIQIRELFSNNPFRIIISPGNHDREIFKKGLYFGDNVVVLESFKKQYTYKGIDIWSLGYEDLDTVEVLERLKYIQSLTAPDRINLLVYHGELLDAFFSYEDFGEEKRRYMPVKLSFFADLNFKYILAGHFHSRFNIREINKNYFVYPGSPVSITERETGQRHVNIFSLPGPPQAFLVDTFYYKVMNIELDPFETKRQIEKIKEEIAQTPDFAKIILNLKGYINRANSLDEKKLINLFKSILKPNDKLIPEFKDISYILEDELFKRTYTGIKQLDNKKELTQMLIKAFITANL